MATPVVEGGIVYSEDQDSRVQAIDLESGAVLWERAYEESADGPNGVIVVGDRVYGATPTKAFALRAGTGKQLWAKSLSRNSREQIIMAPGYRDGLVYFSTSPARYKGNEVGVLWALDARTGRRVWHFDTVPRSLWGRPEINFGGGLSYAPAFDRAGAMYVGVGNAGPIPGVERQPWGSSRPGPNLYSDSVVKLDAETGKVDWHYQVTPHGLCNWDVGAPVLVHPGGRDLVVAASLSGFVVGLDRDSGKLLWRRAVGRHNGHDNDGTLAMRGEYASLQTPMTVYPGKFGGVLGQISSDGKSVFVPVANGATGLTSQTNAVQVGAATGELVALDAATGRVEWSKRFPKPLYGATTVTNDVVFATSFDKSLFAFDAADGDELWSQSLPASVNGGVTVSGGMVLVPAGYGPEGGSPELVAYGLPGS